MNMRRGLGLLAAVAGVALMAFGVVSLRSLLAVPLESQRDYLPQVIFPLVVGMSLFIVGIYFFKQR